VRVALVAIGSRGDVLPFVEVGARLALRGNDVRLVVLRDYAHLAQRPGITVHPVAVDSVDAMWPEVPWLRRAALAQPGVMYALMRRGFARAAQPIADAILAAGADADLVVAGTATRGAVAALAASTSRGFATLLLSPLLPARSSESGVLVPSVGGPVVGAAVSTGMWAMTSSMGAGPARAMRRRVQSVGDEPRGAEELIVSATSPVLSPANDRLTSTSRRVVQAGWIRSGSRGDAGDVRTVSNNLPDPLTTGLPTDLRSDVAAFLDEHPGAVLMTFGSCPSADPLADVDLFTAAARRSGRPLVLQTSALAPGQVAPWVWNAPGVAHEALLPRVEAVVHHGGAGTTTTVLACGRPAVVVPHLGDQAYYARRVTQLGVGSSAGPRWRVTAGGIARHLNRALRPDIVERARALGAALAAEDGAEATAIALEQAAGAWTTRRNT